MSSKVSASDVKNLRERTGAGMMEAKSALAEAGGNLDRALEILRKKGQLRAGKKTATPVGQGIIDAYIHGEGRIGVILEVNCETDFVARSVEFKNLVHDLALHIAASSPLYVSREEVPAGVVDQKFRISTEAAKTEGKSGEVAKKISAGRLEKFYEETCLLEQPFVRDQDITVRELINQKIATIGENIKIKRFTRYVLGE